MAGRWSQICRRRCWWWPDPSPPLLWLAAAGTVGEGHRALHDSCGGEVEGGTLGLGSRRRCGEEGGVPLWGRGGWRGRGGVAGGGREARGAVLGPARRFGRERG